MDAAQAKNPKIQQVQRDEIELEFLRSQNAHLRSYLEAMTSQLANVLKAKSDFILDYLFRATKVERGDESQSLKRQLMSSHHTA